MEEGCHDCRGRPGELETERRYEGAPAVVFGDALVDRVCEIDEMPAAGGDAVIRSSGNFPGGAGLNTSTSLAALGVPCSLVTTVGDDEDGRYLRRHLEAAGVDVSYVGSKGATGYVLSFADSSGERTMFSWRGAASIPVEVTPGLERALQSAPLLLVSGYGLHDDEQAALYLKAAEMVGRAGGIVAFDPAPIVGQLHGRLVERMIAVADVLLANASELRAISGCEAMESGIRAVLQRMPCLGLKLGRLGSMVALGPSAAASCIPGVSGLRPAELNSVVIECPARPVSAVDTTGAGDAFNAGFLAAVLYGMPPRAWGEWGNAMAARVIVRKGACPGKAGPAS
ncbi:MAG: carbohydrate kinase family protein [Betaproteobacteria bacterium]